VKSILLPTATAVVQLNKFICTEGGNPHHCMDIGKIESAISSAFYPGTYPFAHGGLARVAGALCFYLTKCHAFTDGNKRTAVLTAITFLNDHGMDLQYPLDKNTNALATVVDDVAASRVNRDDLMKWFEDHKIYLDE